jgi:ABC-type transporter MlaC component
LVVASLSSLVMMQLTATLLAAPQEVARASAARHLPDPLDELRQADQALISTLRRRVPEWSPEADLIRARLDGLLAGILDHERIAQRALGATWTAMSADQRQQFLRDFSALTDQAFIAALTRPDVRLRYVSETIIGPEASVIVTVTAETRQPAGAATEQLDYRLTQTHGRWLIHDVVVDGVSLVDSYRQQFERVLRSGGVDELLARMRQRLHATH